MPSNNYTSQEPLTETIASIQNMDIELDKIMTNSMHGIFGIPYQFMSSVDRRLPNTELGRKFSEKIISRMPLLFLAPGKQVFMEGFSRSDKQTTIDAILSGVAGDDLDSLLKGFGRYYTVKYAYDEYYRYVNTMCWAVAKFLGIANEDFLIGGNTDHNTTKLKYIDWKKSKNDAFKTFFSAYENVVYYLDGFSSVSENFSNGTTESSLASSVNGLSDQAKEIQFILGGNNSALANVASGVNDALSSTISSLSGVVSNIAGGLIGGIMSGHGVDTILAGGKIVFPELWQDSSFDRSYSLDIKLRSPDHDSLSIYMNILVPYIHLLALTLPRGLDGSTDSGKYDPNGYTSPFLVKAYCKGMFNIDMGIITSLSVTKGAECAWNDDGLPTQIDISIDIKDLYSSLFMTSIDNRIVSYSSVKSVVTNTALMDFLDEIGRKTEMFNMLTESYYQNWPSRIWTSFDQKISNFMNTLYNIV